MAASFLIASACGSSEDHDRSSLDAGPREEEPSREASTPECEGSQSRSCSCDSGRLGRKTCKSGAFGSCVCEAPRSDAGAPRKSLCKAGYYMGNFVGMYLPAMSGGGLFPPELGVMVSGKALDDIPPLAFTLDQNEVGAGEFTSFTVGNGCMTGSAVVFGFVDNPFVARITGSLDCGTGYFDGWLDGQYTLFNLSPVPTRFSGPFTAQFTLPQSLAEGEWDVSEGSSDLTGGSAGGGKGSWQADWESEQAPGVAMDPCADIQAGDAGAPP
ncbi:MAG: hypothetical protein ABW352_15220 [Polyangiales bacterium]